MAALQTTDSEDDPIDKYILKPASKRFGEAGEGEQGQQQQQQQRGALRTDGAGAAVTKKASSPQVSGGDARPAKKRRKTRSKSRGSGKRKGQKEVGSDEEVLATLATSEASPDNRSSSSAPSSSEDEAGRRHVRAPPAPSSGTPAVAPASPAAAPAGVRLVDDDGAGGGGAPLEVRRLLRASRAPRYFDEGAPLKGVACWRCGKRGHVAKDCSSVVERPCVMCAQYGHDKNDCPHRICYRCGRTGHMLRDCTNAASSGASLACARCGRDGCACQGLADFVRFDGLCSGDYHPDDVARTRCFVCGGLGHLSCKPTPLDLPQPSCYNCGDQGHTAAACPQALPPHLKAERAASTRQRALEQMQAQAQAQLQFGQRGGGGGQGYGGGGGGGGGQAWRQGGGAARNGDWFGGFPGTGRQQLQQDRQPYAQQQRQPPQQVQHWQQGQQSWQQQPQQQQHWQQQPQQAYGQGYSQQQQQQQRQQQYWPQQQQQPGPNITDGSRGHGAYGGAAGYGRARDRFSYG